MMQKEILLVLQVVISASSSLQDSTDSFDLAGLTPFPKRFIFSTATASYQVEGAWNASGKGENIWDHITHQDPTYTLDHSNGDIACDSYHKYIEDVNNIKHIGFGMYRFSLSWSRLFPSGFANVSANEDGVRYYNSLIDQLKMNGIEPMKVIMNGLLNPVLTGYVLDKRYYFRFELTM